MKRLLIVLFLLVATTSYAALTTAEKNYLREIYVYYSGQLPNIPQNETIQTTILEGTEAERKAVIKAYLENIVIPNITANLAQMQAAYTDLNNKLTQMQAWVDAN